MMCHCYQTIALVLPRQFWTHLDENQVSSGAVVLMDRLCHVTHLGQLCTSIASKWPVQ